MENFYIVFKVGFTHKFALGMFSWDALNFHVRYQLETGLQISDWCYGMLAVNALKLRWSRTFYFLPQPWHVVVPWPGIKPVPRQWPKPLQLQCQIFNPWCHKRIPRGEHFKCHWNMYNTGDYILWTSFRNWSLCSYKSFTEGVG